MPQGNRAPPASGFRHVPAPPYCRYTPTKRSASCQVPSTMYSNNTTQGRSSRSPDADGITWATDWHKPGGEKHQIRIGYNLDGHKVTDRWVPTRSSTTTAYMPPMQACHSTASYATPFYNQRSFSTQPRKSRPDINYFADFELRSKGSRGSGTRNRRKSNHFSRMADEYDLDEYDYGDTYYVPPFISRSSNFTNRSSARAKQGRKGSTMSHKEFNEAMHKKIEEILSEEKREQNERDRQSAALDTEQAWQEKERQEELDWISGQYSQQKSKKSKPKFDQPRQPSRSTKRSTQHRYYDVPDGSTEHRYSSQYPQQHTAQHYTDFSTQYPFSAGSHSYSSQHTKYKAPKKGLPWDDYEPELSENGGSDAEGTKFEVEELEE